MSMDALAEYQTIEESREALVLYIQENGRIPVSIICNTSQWGTERQMLLDLVELGCLDKVYDGRGTWFINAVKPDRNLGTYRTHGVGGGRDAEIIKEIRDELLTLAFAPHLLKED